MTKPSSKLIAPLPAIPAFVSAIESRSDVASAGTPGAAEGLGAKLRVGVAAIGRAWNAKLVGWDRFVGRDRFVAWTRTVRHTAKASPASKAKSTDD